MQETELEYDFDAEFSDSNASIKVIGVGGGGCNAVSSMCSNNSEEIDYFVMNTDAPALAKTQCINKRLLGKETTHGLGAGGFPEIGRKAAEESEEMIRKVVKGANLVFVACGEGGGTGTGAAPVIARIAKEEGALVYALVTRPFTLEGKNRKNNAIEGMTELRKHVDAITVISNDKLIFNSGASSIKGALEQANAALAEVVKTITDIILKTGVINLDFADVKATLEGRGLALVGIGTGKGPNKAIDAANMAISSPLLESSIRGAKSMIINISMSNLTSMDDLQYAVTYISESAAGKNGEDVSVIMGIQEDETLADDEVKIAIIATAFDEEIMTNAFVAETTPEPVRAQPQPQPQAPRPVQAPQETSSGSSLPGYLSHFLNAQRAENGNEAVQAQPAVQEPAPAAAPAPQETAPAQLQPAPAAQPVNEEDDDFEEDDDTMVIEPTRLR